MSPEAYFWSAAACFAFAAIGVVVMAWRAPTYPNEPTTSLHELMSAEAYDDLPDMDVEAGIVYGASSAERDAWVAEWEGVLAMEYEGGAR